MTRRAFLVIKSLLLQPAQPNRPVPPWLGLIPVAIAFVAMTAWSWRKWGEVLVDFGFQLYMPWQICAGKVLYRDAGWAFGPLSQYYHALLFKLFGVSLTTLIVASLALVAALTAVIYVSFLKAAEQLTATAACLVFLLVFAFSQYVGIGNYNYICPYAYEVVHGLFVSVIAIVFLSRWIRDEKLRFAGAAGLCFGLVFLTKPELFAAITVTTALAFVIELRSQKNRSFTIKSGACFLAFALLPVAGFFLYFAAVMGLANGLHFTFWSWTVMFTTKAARNKFYEWCLGLDDPFENAARMFEHLGGLIAVCAGLFLSFRQMRSRALRYAALLVPLAVFAAAFRFDWGECGRSLPLLCGLICLHLFWEWKHADSSRARVLAFPILWTVFALFLLAKMGLHSRVWHYGFVLAMPATMTVVYYLGWFLPKALERFGLRVCLFRATIYALMAAGVIRLIGLSNEFYRAKTYAVGRGGDMMLTFQPGTNARGKALNLAVDWLEKNTAPDATVACLPEGVLLNYLARRVNPTKYLAIVLMAGQGFDESELVRDFAAARPDYFLLVHRDAEEVGVQYYGHAHNYGLEMMQWIDANYAPVYLIGNEPMRDEKFGIKIFRRKK